MTAMELPVWLDKQDYFDKTVKFLNYYTQPQVLEDLGLKAEDIWLVDNASDHNKVVQIATMFPKIRFRIYHKHYDRTAHLEYPFCWRALYFGRDLFQEYDYDKVIHLNNDVYIISKKLANFIKDYDQGWWCPWCKMYNFSECDLQVINKTCKDYWEVTTPPYLSYNGQYMESVIRAKCDKNWLGNRLEHDIIKPGDDWDFACQVDFSVEIKYNG